MGRTIIMILGVVGGMIVLCLILVLLFGRGKSDKEEDNKIDTPKPLIIPDSISAEGTANTTDYLPRDIIDDSPSTKDVIAPQVEKDNEQKTKKEESKEKPEKETTSVKQEEKKKANT